MRILILVSLLYLCYSSMISCHSSMQAVTLEEEELDIPVIKCQDANVCSFNCHNYYASCSQIQFSQIRNLTAGKNNDINLIEGYNLTCTEILR